MRDMGISILEMFEKINTVIDNYFASGGRPKASEKRRGMEVSSLADGLLTSRKTKPYISHFFNLKFAILLQVFPYPH